MSYAILPPELKAMIIPDLLVRMLLCKNDRDICQSELAAVKRELTKLSKTTIFVNELLPMTSSKCVGVIYLNDHDVIAQTYSLMYKKVFVMNFSFEVKSQFGSYYSIGRGGYVRTALNPKLSLTSLDTITLYTYLREKNIPNAKQIALMAFREYMTTKHKIKRMLTLFVNGYVNNIQSTSIERLVNMFQLIEMDVYHDDDRVMNSISDTYRKCKSLCKICVRNSNPGCPCQTNLYEYLDLVEASIYNAILEL